jgi:glyoxylase-like metal-dependent hydrolase (beta-lactamase superfamily II)
MTTPYQVDVLIQGFPGRAVCHGGLGWSTVTLIRGHGKIILLDVGAFGMRKPIEKSLKEHGVQATQVTDVILTHAHYDHIVNFTLFPNAKIWIGDVEMKWAIQQEPGFNPIPELYVQELEHSPRVTRVLDQEEFLPGITAYAVPGHTPGHLLFVLNNATHDVLFSGDAAKNRAELLSRKVIDTDDASESARSIELIWEKWLLKSGSILIPGHDLTMTLDQNHQPIYIGKRVAAIRTWFSETVEDSELIDLTSTSKSF